MNTSFTVQTDQVGVRLDSFLATKYPEYTRATWQKIIDSGCVTKDGQPLKKSDKLSLGIVKIDYNKPEIQEIDIPVIYEDENVLVVNKPAGVLSHSKGSVDEEATVASFIKDKITIPSSNRAGIVHRLDRLTSGVMITAKNQETATLLQKQFADRKTKKKYIAVVEGSFDEAELILKWPLERNPKKPQTFRVASESSRTKSAETHLKVLKKIGDFSVVELCPKTGRTHQLRVHLSHAGHPIVGDAIYGSTTSLDGRFLLHASELEITIPTSQRRVFVAPIPEDMKEYI